MKHFYLTIFIAFYYSLSIANELDLVLVPSATIAGNATVCQNSASPVITFTGSGGTAPYTFGYTINGNPTVLFATTSVSSSTVTVPVSTTTVGTFTYALVNVKDSQPPSNPVSASGSVTVTVSAPPVVDFTFNNNNTCSGTSIQFNSTVVGSGSYSYSWNFGDGTALSTQQNPSHVFNALGCGTSTFTVILTVTGGGCTVNKSYTITVKQKPNIDFTDVNFPFDPFSNCSNASSSQGYSITVGNVSSSTCVTSYSINWGDGLTENNVTFPKTHLYTQLGVYTMVITAIGSNGCISTKSYTIKNISNPLGGLNSPGSTQNLCAPTTNLQFSISNWGTNSLDTTYTVNYGDGSTSLVLTQNQLINSSFYNSSNPENSANYPIPHVYTTSSCPAASFTVTLDVTNACGTTPFTLGNITVFKKPEANFTAPPIGCVNTSITFTNTTVSGYGQSCNQNAIFTWNFGDGTPTITTPLSSPQNINHTFTTPGTYTVTLTAQNFCGTTTKTQQICIEPPLTPLFTLNTDSGCIPLAITATNNTVLTNQCSTPTYLWSVSYVAANCGTTITPIPNQTTPNASYNFTVPGIYTITLTTTNSCGSTTVSKTVNVKKPPTVSIAALSNTCGVANINPAAIITSCAPTTSSLTYAWSFPGGIPATANTANPGTINYPTAGTYTVSLVVSNECGPSTAATQSFTVNVAPVLTNTTLSQTICSGNQTTLVNLTATPAGTTFTWTAVATPGITGFTPSGTNTIPVQTISTTNTNQGTVTYTIVPTFNGCIGASVNYIINVNPAPTITTQPNSSTVCLNGVPTPLVVSLSSVAGSPTYQWYSNTVNSTIGGTLISGATSATFNPPANTVGTFYYYCVITLSSGGCSSLSSNIATVTVNPLPLITTQPLLTQNGCVGVTISALTASFTGGTGTASYQWFSNTVNSNSGGTLIPGATNPTYTPPVFTNPGNYYYYVIINLNGNGCGTTTSAVAEVVIFNDPIITSQPIPTQTLCQSALPQTLEITATGGNGSFSYQWYSNPTNNTTSGTPISGATNSTFIPQTSTVGTLYYYCIVTQTTPGCSVTSSTAAVIINTSPNIVNQPVSSTVCLGGTPNTLQFSFANGAGTASYQWYSNTTNSTVSGTLIAGATNPTYVPPTDAIGTLYYYCLVTFSGISGSCATISTNTAAITVIPGATINQQPITSQSLCVGGTISIPLSVSFSGGTGTPSYQWYSNTTNSNSGGTLIPGATNSTYTPPVFTTAGTYFYYAIINFSGSGCGAISSNVAEIIIVIDPVITTQPFPTQTLCQNAIATDLTVEVSGGVGSTYNYQWYSNTNNNTTSGTPISGATNPTFTPQTSIVGTIYYYCIITQTTPGCSVTSATAAVIVNTSPTIVNQPVSSTVCLGGTPNTLQFSFANGAGTASYQWYSNTTNSTVSGTAIVGATNPTFIPPSDTIGTLYYYCLVTFSGITGSCATISTNTAAITVIPGATIDQQPIVSQSLCVGGTLSIPLSVSFSGGTGTASYQWYSNSTNSNTGGTLIPGAVNTTYTPPVFTAAGSYYYYAIINFSGSGCGAITSDVAEIIIVIDPIITTQPLPTQTLCQNAIATDLTVEVSGGVGTAYNYQWYVSSTNSTTAGTPISGATNQNFTPPTTIAGTLYYYCIVTQPNNTGCNVTSTSATINVNLAPSLTVQPISDTICLGQSTPALSFTFINGLGTPTYQWYSNSIASNIGGLLLTGATNSTYTPAVSIVGTTYYYCVINFPDLSGGCEIITTDIAAIIVNQIPVITNESTTICSGTTFTVIPANSGGNIIPSGTTYIWSEPIINPSGAITGASQQNIPQTEISQTLFNTTSNTATVTYTVIPTSGSCEGDSFTVTVTVNPSINPNSIVTNSSCFGIDNGSITTNITGGVPFSTGAPYLINWTGPNGFVSTATTLSNLEPGIYTLTVDDAGGCPFTDSYTITEPDDLLLTIDSANDITCFNSANGSITISISGGTGNYFYTWTFNGTPFSTEEDLSNLSPGNYSVSVTDINNCGPKTANFVITEPPLLEVNLVGQTNVECFGDSTGTIAVVATGGTIATTYTFSWSGPNGFTSSFQNLDNLIAGTYLLTVTDDNECEALLSVTLTQSPEIIITYTTTPISCYGANDATLAVTLSGGVPPFQFTWNNLSTSLNQNNLSAGDYIITVTDSFGCVRVETINIPEAPVFTVNPIVNQITCFGANNGSINLNLTGGIPPVALTWSDGSTAGLIRNNLPPGTYTATISDGTPCYIVRTFTIIEPQPLVLSTSLTQPTDCLNSASGAINLIVSGGTPPFTYLWTNGTTTEDLSGVVAGNYGVTVTDANGCVITGQYTLIRPNPLVVSVTTQTDADCETREVLQYFVAQASGGVPPYTYEWSSGTISGTNNQIMQTDTNGMVILTVTDGLGCSITYNVNVDNPIIGNPSIEATSFGYLTYGIYSISDAIQFYSNATGDYVSIIWDFGDGTFSNEENPLHTYEIEKEYVVTLTVTYPFGCVYVLTISLLVEKGYFLVIPSAFTPNNDGLNDTFRPVSKRLKNLRMDVFDSWGSMIYSETGEVLIGWDGKIKGINAENGNYYSVITAETFYGTIIKENQTFVLIQ